MGTLNSVNIYDVYLSGLNRFPLVILRPLPVPLPLPFPIVPFPDSGFTEVMKFQRLFKLLSGSFLHTCDHISKSWLKDVIKRKGVQVMELTFGIDLLPPLSSCYFFFPISLFICSLNSSKKKMIWFVSHRTLKKP